MDLIGSAIKQLRTQQKLSTYDLAKMTGIAQSTLSKLENGKRNADVDILQKISKALKVEINEIIQGPKTLREILFNAIFEKNVTFEEMKAETNLELSEIKEALTSISSYHPDYLYKVCKALGISKGFAERSEEMDLKVHNHYGYGVFEKKLISLFEKWYSGNEIRTMAAHHDSEDWTEEELEEIENFKKYVLSKRKK